MASQMVLLGLHQVARTATEVTLSVFTKEEHDVVRAVARANGDGYPAELRPTVFRLLDIQAGLPRADDDTPWPMVWVNMPLEMAVRKNLTDNREGKQWTSKRPIWRLVARLLNYGKRFALLRRFGRGG